MKSHGWVKLYRQLLDSRYGGNLEMLGLFTALLLKAQHRDSFAPDGTPIKKGQLLTSQTALAREFGLNRETLRRKLKVLENAQQIEQRGGNKNTVITVLNWDKYQTDEQQNEQQVSSKCATDEHQVSTYNNVKNVNNEKKNKYTAEFEKFWEAMPHRTGTHPDVKGRAFNAYKAAKKNGSKPDYLLERANLYSKSVEGQDMSKIVMTAKWLREEHFLANYEAMKAQPDNDEDLIAFFEEKLNGN